MINSVFNSETFQPKLAHSIVIEPVISYPHVAQIGKTYLLSIDLQPSKKAQEWPYDEEEYTVCCIVESQPFFECEPVGEPNLVLHRFGGTYGPVTFYLKPIGGDETTGAITIYLSNGWGIPLDEIHLKDIKVVQESDQSSRSISRRSVLREYKEKERAAVDSSSRKSVSIPPKVESILDESSKLVKNPDFHSSFPRVLIVENDVRTRRLYSEFLHEWGYIPILAEGEGIGILKSAKLKASANRCQFALIDMRLIDDQDEDDRSGIKLIPELAPAVCILVADYVNLADAREAVEGGAVGVIGKGESPETLREKLDSVAKTLCAQKSRVNIEPIEIVDYLKRSLLIITSQEEYHDQIVDVLTRLFPNAGNLQLEMIGASPKSINNAPRPRSTILRVFENDKQPVIVKIARIQKIKQEIEHYQRYIEGQLMGQFIPVLKDSCLLWDIGGLKLSYIEPPDQTFSNFCKTQAIGNIRKSLNHFFENTWGPHYLRARDVENTSLFEMYCSVWNNDWVERVRSYDFSLNEVESMRIWKEMRASNPIEWMMTNVINERDVSIVEKTKVAVTHGNFHGDNLLVDAKNNMWVVNFERTGEGFILQDFIELEADLIFRLQGTQKNVQDFLAACLAVSTYSQIDKIELKKTIQLSPETEKVLQIISHIRQLAYKRTGINDARQYIIGLLFNTLFRATMSASALTEHSQGLALLFASILCHRLDHWRESWPPQEWHAILQETHVEKLNSVGWLDEPLQGRILVVDNLPEWRSTVSNILRHEGYLTRAVASRKEALAILKKERFHIAVMEKRLDVFDEDNQEGLELLDEINQRYPSITVIMLTGYADVEMVRKALLPVNGRQPAYSVILKNEMMGLPETVRGAFQESLRLNLELVIDDPDGCIYRLAGQVRFPNGKTPATEEVGLQFRELFCKLFFECEKIRLGQMQQGFRGAAVIQVTPTYQGKGEGQGVVVKIGNWEEISTEIRNYEHFVKGIEGGHQFPESLRSTSTPLVSGIQYSFIGLSGQAENFASFYQSATLKDIRTVLESLYLDTLFPLKEKTGRVQIAGLREFYWRHLHLTDEKLKKVASMAIGTGLAFTEESDGILLSTDGKRLVNPIKFAQQADFYVDSFFATIHGDLNGQNILLGPHNDVWLIDFFATTDDGHILQDYAALETNIRFLLTLTNEIEMSEWVRVCGNGDILSTSISPEIKNYPTLLKAHQAITHIRELAAKTIQYSDKSYLIALFYNTLRLTTFSGIPSITRNRALFYAALIAEKIKTGGV